MVFSQTLHNVKEPPGDRGLLLRHRDVTRMKGNTEGFTIYYVP